MELKNYFSAGTVTIEPAITTIIFQFAGIFAIIFAKFFIALAFIIPVIYLDLATAIVVSVVCGMLALCLLSFLIAKSKKEKPALIILEHLFIACVVIVVAYYSGSWISCRFV